MDETTRDEIVTLVQAELEKQAASYTPTEDTLRALVEKVLAERPPVGALEVAGATTATDELAAMKQRLAVLLEEARTLEPRYGPGASYTLLDRDIKSLLAE